VENVYDYIGTLVKEYKNIKADQPQFEIPEADHPYFNVELLKKPPKRGHKPKLPKMKKPFVNQRYLSQDSEEPVEPVIKKRRVTDPTEH
jgi:hypothetical protein